MELQLLLLSEQPLLVFYLVLQAQDEAVGVNGIGVAPTIWILHKDLDLGGDGLQQTDSSVAKDPEIGQGAAAAEELALTTGRLKGQTLQARAALPLPDLLFNLLYGLIWVHHEDQIWAAPLLHSHLDVSCPLQEKGEREVESTFLSDMPKLPSPVLLNSSSSSKHLGSANHLPGPMLGAFDTFLKAFYSHSSPMRGWFSYYPILQMRKLWSRRVK